MATPLKRAEAGVNERNPFAYSIESLIEPFVEFWVPFGIRSARQRIRQRFRLRFSTKVLEVKLAVDPHSGVATMRADESLAQSPSGRLRRRNWLTRPRALSNA